MSSISLVKYCCFYENMVRDLILKCDYYFSILDVSVRKLLHPIFDAGSVVYN